LTVIPPKISVNRPNLPSFFCYKNNSIDDAIAIHLA
jgi:hypothetical protein